MEIDSQDIELLCIGNAMVDVFAKCGDREFGLDQPVQHIPMEKMREILSALPRYSVCSGGGAANAAKIAGMLGIKTCFIGALGAASVNENETPGISDQSDRSGQSGQSDQFGKQFEYELGKAGVQTILPCKNTPTGVCLILQMPDNKTKIAACPSAALELSQEDINEDLIRRAEAVVLDGFMLGRRSLVRYILELSDRYGTAVALDLSATGLAYERAAEIITYARAYPLIIFMNEDEADAFYRALSKKDSPPKNENGLGPEMTSLFKTFTSNDIFPIINVKLGMRGAVVFAGGNVYRESTVPVIPLEITGAGDAFCAAFLAAWIREKPLSVCAAFGNRAARTVLDVNGTNADPKALKNLGRELK